MRERAEADEDLLAAPVLSQILGHRAALDAVLPVELRFLHHGRRSVERVGLDEHEGDERDGDQDAEAAGESHADAGPDGKGRHERHHVAEAERVSDEEGVPRQRRARGHGQHHQRVRLPAVASAVEDDGDVRNGILPAGRFVVMTHAGAPQTLMAATAALLSRRDASRSVFLADTPNGEPRRQSAAVATANAAAVRGNAS